MRTTFDAQDSHVGGGMMPQKVAASIDEYVSAFPEGTREALERVRALIHESAPDAVETISYAIPTFDLDGRHVVSFAGYEHHIGLYPVPLGAAGFDDLAPYASGKATARFRLGEPLPDDLIRRVVVHQVERIKSGR